jgi:hypothetical protein
VSGSAADLNIRLGRISNTAAAGAADLPRPVILRARQGQWHRRDFGRITVDSCSRLRQHSAYPVSAFALLSGDDEDSPRPSRRHTLPRLSRAPALSTPYLPPQHPQVSRPDKRKAGRQRRFSRSARAFRTPLIVDPNCVASSAWRNFTRCHNSSSTIRSSGTSVLIHLVSGFGRDTRLPVFGSLMKRCRFQTSTPA